MGNFNLQKSKSVIKKLLSYRIWIQAVALLALSPTIANAQYFQRLYDCDTTDDWVWNILQNANGTWFVAGEAYALSTEKWIFCNMTLSPDGSSVIEKKIYSCGVSNMLEGSPGAMKRLSDSSIISPLTIQTPNNSYFNATSGFMKLKKNGDTVFTKLYSDTSKNYDYLSCLAILPDDGFIAGGGRAPNIYQPYPALVIRADSVGDTLWTKTYQKTVGSTSVIYSIIPIDDNRIVLGASSNTTVTYSTSTIDFNAPWFIVADSAGNIIKDTLYDYHDYFEFLTGGEGAHIIKDKNGGYLHFGWLNQINVPGDISNLHNFPAYVAHLDTNFRITWKTIFPYSDTFGNRGIERITQTADSNYLAYGCMLSETWAYGRGWIAKIDRNGSILWQRTYLSDSMHDAYLEALAEKPDGSLVMVGATFNDTLPTWHYGRDVWLVGVDSSGCNVGGCWWPTETREVQILEPDISVYPNPTTGNLTALSTQAGKLEVYTVTGQLTGRYLISAGVTTLQLPGVLASGVYIGSFRPEGGGKPSNIRIVLRP